MRFLSCNRHCWGTHLQISDCTGCCCIRVRSGEQPLRGNFSGQLWLFKWNSSLWFRWRIQETIKADCKVTTWYGQHFCIWQNINRAILNFWIVLSFNVAHRKSRLGTREGWKSTGLRQSSTSQYWAQLTKEVMEKYLSPKVTGFISSPNWPKAKQSHLVLLR